MNNLKFETEAANQSGEIENRYHFKKERSSKDQTCRVKECKNVAEHSLIFGVIQDYRTTNNAFGQSHNSFIHTPLALIRVDFCDKCLKKAYKTKLIKKGLICTTALVVSLFSGFNALFSDRGNELWFYVFVAVCIWLLASVYGFITLLLNKEENLEDIIHWESSEKRLGHISGNEILLPTPGVDLHVKAWENNNYYTHSSEQKIVLVSKKKIFNDNKKSKLKQYEGSWTAAIYQIQKWMEQWNASTHQ